VGDWLWDRGGLQIEASDQNLIRVKVAAVVAIVVAVVMGDGVRRRRAAGEWNGDRGGFGGG